MLSGILANDANPIDNAEPTTRTNETTVTVHLIGAEGWYDAVHLAEDVEFSSNTQSYWRPPLGSYDGGTTVTFILSSGDALKTIWAVLDSGGETFSTPPTSATLTLDTIQPDVTSSTLQTQPNLRLYVSMVFSESVHEFSAGDIWLGGVAISVENFAGEGTEYSFDVIASGEGELTIGFHTDEVFDLAGNPVIEQASPLVEYYPFIPLETPGATESAALTGGFFLPPLASVEEPAGETNMMLMGTMDPVWVDFEWQEPLEGVEAAPFNTLQDGLANVVDSGTVIIKAGTSAEALTIDQPVRLEASGGTVRIGDPAAGQTQFIQFPFGLPMNTPNNGVITQVVRGSNAPIMELEIAEIRTITNGQGTVISSDSMELVQLTDGNYDLLWKAPGGVNLSSVDSIEIDVNEIQGQSSTLAETVSLPITAEDQNLKWLSITFGSNVDVWGMDLPPYSFKAIQGSVYWHAYAFEVGKSYDLEIKKLATITSPPPDPYLGWEAFTFNLGSDIDGWQAGAGFWAYDPDNVIGTDVYLQEKNGGGKAVIYVDDLRIVNPLDPDNLYLVETAYTLTQKLLQNELTLQMPGLNSMIQGGLDEDVAEIIVEQTEKTNPIIGRVRLYDATDPENLNLLLDSNQDSATIPLTSIGPDDEMPLIIEGVERGFGSLDNSPAAQTTKRASFGAERPNDLYRIRC
jgi:hypothetical protein